MSESSFLNPAKVIESLLVDEGMKVAEFGSGTGLFTLQLAQKVGRDGKVYAIDVQKYALDALRAKTRTEGMFNVETIWADLEKPGATKIADNDLDCTFVPNMLFQSQQKTVILKEAFRITKPSGIVTVIDWLPEKAIFGKAMGWPIEPSEMQKAAEAAGLTFVQQIQTGSAYHYGLLFRK